MAVKKGTVKEPVYEYVGNLVKVRWGDGGVVPEALSGMYTHMSQAKQAVEVYLASRRTPKNAKANTGNK